MTSIGLQVTNRPVAESTLTNSWHMEPIVVNDGGCISLSSDEQGGDTQGIGEVIVIYCLVLSLLAICDRKVPNRVEGDWWVYHRTEGSLWGKPMPLPTTSCGGGSGLLFE